MSYSLNSSKRVIGDYIGTTIGVIEGDTRSLDSGSYRCIREWWRITRNRK